jgi:hypothetical protein
MLLEVRRKRESIGDKGRVMIRTRTKTRRGIRKNLGQRRVGGNLRLGLGGGGVVLPLLQEGAVSSPKNLRT